MTTAQKLYEAMSPEEKNMFWEKLQNALILEACFEVADAEKWLKENAEVAP